MLNKLKSKIIRAQKARNISQWHNRWIHASNKSWQFLYQNTASETNLKKFEKRQQQLNLLCNKKLKK